MSLALALAACHSSRDDEEEPSAQGSAAEEAAPVRCVMDTTVTPFYEERRLPNKLSASDAVSFSSQILGQSGFDQFGPAFSEALRKDGWSRSTTYDDALKLVTGEGRKLWRAAVDRVQGRRIEGAFSASDDRPLYWDRLTMTQALRQWAPEFSLSQTQRDSLQWAFEVASRGQDSIDFPAGDDTKRILVSGFDPFISQGGMPFEERTAVCRPLRAFRRDSARFVFYFYRFRVLHFPPWRGVITVGSSGAVQVLRSDKTLPCRAPTLARGERRSAAS